VNSIDLLASEYLKHEQLYRSGLAEITNLEFDSLQKELERLAPDHPVFRVVESGRKLLSLGNQSVESWLEKIPANTDFIVQPKIDGVALALRYVDGKLAKAWTRKGTDKTERIRLVEDIPEILWHVDKVNPHGSIFEIRGELFAPRCDPAQSQRLAAGFLRKKCPKDAEGLSFAAFEILNGSVEEFPTEKDVLESLAQWCFEHPLTWEVPYREKENIRHLHNLWLDGQFHNHQYPSDGIVVKIKDRKIQKKLGSSSVCPFWALAIKEMWKTC
tara:strand:- start:1268 stop:2083 length:816 start_codon:yes stop_codon:yes gene_type:complete